MTTRATWRAPSFSRSPQSKSATDGELLAAEVTETVPAHGPAPADVAERQLATFIHIHRDGGSQVITVNAADLELLLHEGILVPLDSTEVDWPTQALAKPPKARFTAHAES